MTTFQDIFKTSFLDNIESVSLLDMAIGLGLAFAIGLFIFLIYKKTFSGVMYSANFGVTLIALTMISTLVIMAVTSNIVLSLGMVGALSIVRFRTAIKDPLDVAFLFWSIATGIVLAAGLLTLALFGSLLIGAILLIFVNKKGLDSPYIIVVSCEDQAAESAARQLIGARVKKSSVKSATVSAKGVELTMEVRLKEQDGSFIHELAALTGVNNAVLVSYNGDYLN